MHSHGIKNQGKKVWGIQSQEKLGEIPCVDSFSRMLAKNIKKQCRNVQK